MPRPLGDFLRHVLPHVPECPAPLAETAVLNTAIEFADRTKIARVKLAPVSLEQDEPEYPLPIGTGRRLVFVIHATVEKHPLVETSVNELDLQWPHRRDLWPQVLWASDSTWTPWREFKEGIPSLYYMLQPATIRLVGIPTEVKVGALEVEIATKPTPDATEVEDVLYDDWHETIAHGALFRVLSMPGKSWQNNTLAKMHNELYHQQRLEAEGRVGRDFIRDDRATMRTRTYYR